VTAGFSSNPAMATSSTLTLKAASRASRGTYTLTITGTSGTYTRTTKVSLKVTRYSGRGESRGVGSDQEDAHEGSGHDNWPSRSPIPAKEQRSSSAFRDPSPGQLPCDDRRH